MNNGIFQLDSNNHVKDDDNEKWITMQTECKIVVNGYWYHAQYITLTNSEKEIINSFKVTYEYHCCTLQLRLETI